jgi:hypothetical protein
MSQFIPIERIIKPYYLFSNYVKLIIMNEKIFDISKASFTSCETRFFESAFEDVYIIPLKSVYI